MPRKVELSRLEISSVMGAAYGDPVLDTEKLSEINNLVSMVEYGLYGLENEDLNIMRNHLFPMLIKEIPVNISYTPSDTSDMTHQIFMNLFERDSSELNGLKIYCSTIDQLYLKEDESGFLFINTDDHIEDYEQEMIDEHNKGVTYEIDMEKIIHNVNNSLIPKIIGCIEACGFNPSQIEELSELCEIVDRKNMQDRSLKSGNEGLDTVSLKM